jgi:hypothetical protein
MAGGSPDEIRTHVDSIAARSQRDAQKLADALSGRSWPGSGCDRTEPGALAWLKRWGPSGPAPLTPLCGCARGRCLLCN